jgi:AcrR family transcriptional regulator
MEYIIEYSTNKPFYSIVLDQLSRCTMIDHDEMKEQIITAAKEIFARYGYKKTTMDDIAASIYKAKSSIYHYFSSKEDIFKAVIEREAAHIQQEIRDAVGNESTPVAKLIAYFSTGHRAVRETVNYFRLLMDEWFEIFDFTDDIKRKNEEEGFAILSSIMREGNETGVFAIESPEEYARAISIGFHGYLLPIGLWSGEALPENLNIFLKIMLQGLLKR